MSTMYVQANVLQAAATIAARRAARATFSPEGELWF